MLARHLLETAGHNDEERAVEDVKIMLKMAYTYEKAGAFQFPLPRTSKMTMEEFSDFFEFSTRFAIREFDITPFDEDNLPFDAPPGR